MKILYIFPHPDDESFGPVAAMSAQLRKGHEVYLLTLTKGGATKQRHKFGLKIEEMGEIRYNEMLNVKKVLNLTDLVILDFPDSQLKEMDPRELEMSIEKEIKKIKPNIVITYPVYGVSGFGDHIVTHAVVKRLYLQLKSEGEKYLKRLAFFTLGKEEYEKNKNQNPFCIKPSPDELIDCIVPIDEKDREKMKEALNCHKSYESVIEKSDIANAFDEKVCFEFFQENFKPPVQDVTENLVF